MSEPNISSTTTSAVPEWLGRARGTLRYVGAGSALLLVVGYVIGFLVVNNYLANYGVRDVEPIRTRYLAAAVPFAALIALTIFALVEMESGPVGQLAARRPRGWSRGLAALLRVGLIVFFAALLNFFLLLYLGGVPTGSLSEAAATPGQ